MNRFQNILYVSGQSAEDISAFQTAVSLAEHNGAALAILDVLEPLPDYMTRGVPATIQKFRRKDSASKLKEYKNSAKAKVNIAVRTVEGRPFVTIIQEVLQSQHDLVVKAAEDPDDLVEQIFGPTDKHLLRKCPCPVLILNTVGKKPIRRVLAAIDLDEFERPGGTTDKLNRKILDLAISVATMEQAELHLIYAWTFYGESMLRGMRSYMSADEISAVLEDIERHQKSVSHQFVESAKSAIGADAYSSLKHRTHLIQDSPERAIPKLATDLDIDLLVMGTVGRSGIAGLIIGNTAEAVLDRVKCSVLALKPDGFVTPVV